MKYFKAIVFFISMSFILIACEKNLLEKLPTDQVSSEVFFYQPNDMMIYMNQFYAGSLFAVRWGNLIGNTYDESGNGISGDDRNSDDMITYRKISELLEGSRTISYGNGPGWSFKDVRSINYFFDNYKKSTAKFDDYKQYVGEAHFFRALIYFVLLKKFGDVPWYSNTLQTNSPELYDARTPRNVVADNIIKDLDSAAMYLTGKRNGGASRVYKGLALGLQSRVALYEGTWEKYHAGDPFGVSNPQPEKYFNKVIEATTTIMNSGQFEIYNKGNSMSDYNDLFKMQDYSSTTEAMFLKQFSSDLSVFNQKNYKLAYPLGECLTKELADSYLCTDGNPITGNALFGGYSTISTEVQNRDPRFYQTIFTPSAPWLVDNNSVKLWREAYVQLNTVPSFYAGTGYVLRKGYDPLLANQNESSETDPIILFRYAEVLLNFAEAKAELGTITQIDLDKSIGLLRSRVGMPNISLGNIKTDPNWNFPDLSPIINEIRRERHLELATEGLRWMDIARWAGADELIVGKRPKGFKASQLSTDLFPVDKDGFLDPFQLALPSGYGFVINRDYLDPIPQGAITLNPKLTQNPGW